MSFSNKRKVKRLDKEIPKVSIFDSTCDINSRMKFNFSYFDLSQANGPGQFLKDWTDKQQEHLHQLLVEYSKKPLNYWESEGVLVVYGAFPKKSDFALPTFTPIEAEWARFRLGSRIRLAGFIIPDKCGSGEKYPVNMTSNTFYVVFLDRDHGFYKSEKK